MQSADTAADNRGCTPLADAGAGPPAVAAAFRWDHEPPRLILRCVPLAQVAQHAFTSVQLPLRDGRITGSSGCGPASGDSGLDARTTLRVHQVHGSAVRVVRSDDAATQDPDVLPDGDAIVADVPGVALAVRVADCVPVLVAAAAGGAAAAVHAGWRGTCAGVTRAAIEALRRQFGVTPSALVAAIGPSIGPEDYEVGDEVREAFAGAGHAPAELAQWFVPGRQRGRWWLNLWAANRDQLRQAGVPAAAIHVAGVSTLAHPGWLESFRRDGPRAGRMTAVIVVPGPRLPAARR